jgi:hypothetical protein
VPLAIDSDIDRPLIETGGFDAGNKESGREAIRDFFPAAAFIPGDMDVAVVGPGVDQPFFERRFGNGPDSRKGDISLLFRVEVG